MSTPLFSIIISTRNRAEYLRPTLESLTKLRVEAGAAELLLADNGSHDSTAELFQVFSPLLQASGIEPRYIWEPQPGACRARNRCLRYARGEIIFLTDDDVRLPPDWLRAMSAPLREGQAEAVAGGVRLAPHLERPWMTPLHRAWLAATEEDKCRKPYGEPGRIISANMAFLRSNLQVVPGFDDELGPGALGFCDDILFSLQFKEAGLRLFPLWDVEVEHHFDASRLSRTALMQRAEAEGRSTAYFWYHWLQEPVPYPALKAVVFAAQLKLFQRKHASTPGEEGCSEREMRLAQKAACYRQYLIERRRPLQYGKRGLRKKEVAA